MIFLLLLSFIPAEKEGAALLVGSQQAEYSLNLPSSTLPSYSNNGFKQIVDEKGFIQVKVSNQPMRSRAKARPVPRLEPELADLEMKLRSSNRRLMADQVGTVLNWLRTRIHYSRKSLNSHSPRELPNGKAFHLPPEESLIQHVLAGKRADCVGLSELAVHIFHELGINARFVTGVAFRKDDPARLMLKGDVLHRWIEVEYPDIGWVFSDPSGKVNYVEATYVVLGVWGEHPVQPVVNRLFGKEIELHQFLNGFQLFSCVPEFDGRVGVRPNMLFQ
ncbi:MAG: hypothetical protein CSA81_02310 [Acidobacteria bacterium]|nr:MAG: hypothetical protein CSA81_02310 [Acidobacteriota bacterium]